MRKLTPGELIQKARRRKLHVSQVCREDITILRRRHICWHIAVQIRHSNSLPNRSTPACWRDGGTSHAIYGSVCRCLKIRDCHNRTRVTRLTQLPTDAGSVAEGCCNCRSCPLGGHNEHVVGQVIVYVPHRCTDHTAAAATAACRRLTLWALTLMGLGARCQNLCHGRPSTWVCLGRLARLAK